MVILTSLSDSSNIWFILVSGSLDYLSLDKAVVYSFLFSFNFALNAGWYVYKNSRLKQIIFIHRVGTARLPSGP